MTAYLVPVIGLTVLLIALMVSYILYIRRVHQNLSDQFVSDITAIKNSSNIIIETAEPVSEEAVETLPEENTVSDAEDADGGDATETSEDDSDADPEPEAEPSEPLPWD